MAICRALLIEDDLRLASSIVQYLELQDIVCDHCGDGHQALNLVARNTYDVLVSDINMPRMSGLDLCQQLRQSGCSSPIIMITSRADLEDKEQGFEAGADDYLVKPFALKELFLRVKALSRRRSNQTNIINIPSLELEIDCTQFKVKRCDTEVPLPKSSWALLAALARAWPEPVSKRDLEFALWGDEVPDSNALKVHIHHLRQRLDHPFEYPIVQAIRGLGFVLARQAATSDE
jgi:DNA-binding response OmpR family regulator